jgi:hypothetical protein
VLVIVAVVTSGIPVPLAGTGFGLVLLGRFDPSAQAGLTPPSTAEVMAASRSGLLARPAGAGLVAGFGLLTVADAGWAHAIGVLSLAGLIALGFLAARPDRIAKHEARARRTASTGGTALPNTWRMASMSRFSASDQEHLSAGPETRFARLHEDHDGTDLGSRRDFHSSRLPLALQQAAAARRIE